MKGKYRRMREGIKTFLILLLACSAIFLASRALFPRQDRASFSAGGQDSEPDGLAHSFSAQTIRPAAFAITWEEGRYGVLYHQEDQESYTQVSALLAEALSSARAPQQVTRSVWLRALSSPGVFCEYLGAMPLDALGRWLSGQAAQALAGHQARQVCITANALYFRDRANKLWSCQLSGDLGATLDSLFPLHSPNGAHFAVENAKFHRLRPDTLVLPSAPQLPQLSAADPVTPSATGTVGEPLRQILQVLSFHPQTNPLYDITGGWAITDSGETLRIGIAGQITYRKSDDAQPRYSAQDPLADTRALAEKTVGAVCGAGRLYLRELRQEGSATVIGYGYAYRGAAILVDGESCCAQFTVENGAITAFTLRPRHYTALEDAPALLLPQEQAAALSGAGERTLELLYDDRGGAQTLAPFWAVRNKEG